MTKSELIARLAAANPHLYQRDVERIVSTIFDEISEALARGDRVELRGFGACSVKSRGSGVGRDPRTGDAVQVVLGTSETAAGGWGDGAHPSTALCLEWLCLQ